MKWLNGSQEFQTLYSRKRQTEDFYFQSYDRYKIHEVMLQDEARMKAYAEAIQKNSAVFKDKVVMDVGTGTGVLAIFAAQAGAKHVYAVENSNIIEYAKRIVKKNKLTEKITLIRDKVENIDLEEQVDIIVSEWMGYFLLYEGMLDSIIFARDNFLKPEGLIFPNRCSMYLAGSRASVLMENKMEIWNNFYGIDMSDLKQISSMDTPTEFVDKNDIITGVCKFQEIDLEKVLPEELNFKVGFSFPLESRGEITALVGWFDVFFDHCEKPVVLTTSPWSEETHWKQTIFLLEQALKGNKGEVVDGKITIAKSPSCRRDLDIKITYSI